MTNFSVQRLRPDDLQLMRGVNCLFGDAFDDAERYHSAPPDDDHLRRSLATDQFIALAALREGEVVGALTGYELIKYEREALEIYLYDLAVVERCRRQGIATALIEEVRNIAVKRGAEIVFVQADAEDEAAVALYERFSKRRDVFHFDISPR